VDHSRRGLVVERWFCLFSFFLCALYSSAFCSQKTLLS
jgi:hypothetical protein